MALINPSSVVAEISGRVGNNVFSRNRGGVYVKDYAPPVHPNSPAQVGARLWMSNAADAWSVLSDSEVKAWDNFKLNFSNQNRLGINRPLSTRAFFISCYINRRSLALSGSPVPELPPIISVSNLSVDTTNGSFPRATLTGTAADSRFGVALFSHDATNQAVRSINTIPMTLFHFRDYSPAPTYLFSFQWSDNYTGYSLPSFRRVFIRARVIHKNSGIEVANLWNYGIRDNTPPPVVMGVDTIGSSSYSSAFALSQYASPDASFSTSKGYVYFKSAVASARIAVYDYTYPNITPIVATSNLSTGILANAWHEFTFPSPVSLTGFNDYFLAVHASGSVDIAVDNSGTVIIDNTAPSASFNDPFLNTSTAAKAMSIYLSS